MIDILILRDEQGNICRLKVGGHSGYDEAGRDIVCSAVSVLVQTAAIGLVEIVGIKPDYHQKKGLADLKIPLGISSNKIREINIILETTLLGLRSIELGYDKYITIRERKVE